MTPIIPIIEIFSIIDANSENLICESGIESPENCLAQNINEKYRMFIQSITNLDESEELPDPIDFIPCDSFSEDELYFDATGL